MTTLPALSPVLMASTTGLADKISLTPLLLLVVPTSVVCLAVTLVLEPIVFTGITTLPVAGSIVTLSSLLLSIQAPALPSPLVFFVNLAVDTV